MASGRAKDSYRVRTRPGSTAYCPDAAKIDVERNGTAYLVFDGVRALRADSLTDLMQQLHLSAEEIEREPA